jgi:peptidoglycan/xylan/chitin deacetylase (PgdA/CDA1 family)
MSRFLRRAAESAAVGRAVGTLEALESRRKNLLRILTYHHVGEPGPFALQMEHLAGRYPVVSIGQVLSALDGGEPLPPRAVLLTFDDAYRDFASVAWPILRAHGFPAVLFVPSAYPDSDAAGFWWDRLERAFAATPRRDELVTPVGVFSLASAGERARAHRAVKRFVKDLGHEETLIQTEALCAALRQPLEPHEVLSWSELRALAREGVSLGAHTRSHPRLDRIDLERARDEIVGSVQDLAREIPGMPRLFAYPDGRFSDEIVEIVRAAGVELAFTTRHGSNDLGRCDRLRLRRFHVDARDSPGIFRAKIVYSSPRWNGARRLLDPRTEGERESERAARSEGLRSRLFYRSLDAALTAGLRPGRGALETLRRASSPKSSHYERLGALVQLVTWRRGQATAIGSRVQHLLLRPERLPLRDRRVELLGFGSGTTVFALARPENGHGPAGAGARVLKIYRRTLGRGAGALWQAARRYRWRYEQLRAWFGQLVQPAEFLVLHAPLLSSPAVGCLQAKLGQGAGELEDPFELADEELLRRLRAAPELGRQFTGFSRTALALFARGVFPDLLGRGNLLIVPGEGGVSLRLIDYGIFDLKNPPAPGVPARVERQVRRLEALLAQLDGGGGSGA